MSTSAAPTVQPPQAPMLQWLVAIPLLYVLLSLVAMLLVTTTVAGLRASGRPVSTQLVAIRTLETQLVAGIPANHPVRYAVSGLEITSAFVARHITALKALAAPEYLDDIGNAAYIVLRRGFMAFGLLAPMLVVFAAAAQDGLAQRELRKLGNDPESAFVYHSAKKSVGTWVGLVVAVYLLIPVALHPHVVLCVLTPICAYAIALAVTKYKKHL